MVSKATAKEKGARIQRAVAVWYQRIWPAATTQGAGTPGRDVLNVPVSIEVKARRDFDPANWVRQAMKRRRLVATPLGGGLTEVLAADEFPPWVVLCPFGLDHASVAYFMVIQDLAGHTAMVEELVQLREWKRTAVCGEGCTGRECSFCEPCRIEADAAVQRMREGHGSQEARQAK